MRTLLIVASVVILVATLVVAGWLVLGSVVVAVSGTLPGGWAGVWMELLAVLVPGVSLAGASFYVAVRKPKPLRSPD